MRSARALFVVLGLLGGCGPSRSGGFGNATPDDVGADDATAADLPMVPDAAVPDVAAPADLPAPRDVASADAGVDAPALTDARTEVSGADVRGSDGGTAVDASSSGDGGACGARDLGSRVGPSLATGATTGGASTLEGTCGGDAVDEAVFTWVAPADGDYDFSAEGSDFDTVLYVREGLCTETELDCNDDSDTLQSLVTLTLRAGQRVTVVLDGYGNNSGNYVLGITPVAAADAGAPTD